MKDDDIEKPQAMKIRKGIQDAMNYSLPEKVFNENKIDLVDVNININNLGREFHNFRILNLCDIHLGQWINEDYLNDLVDYVNQLNYDLITLTGDYISYSLDEYIDYLKKAFKNLKAPMGKFGVLGNHDHWASSEQFREIFKYADIVDLSNNVTLLEKGSDKLNLCGVDSCTVCCDNLDKVISKLDKNYLFDFQISGHSHGGQFIIPKFETTPFRGPNSTKYPVGLYKIGNMLQYTSKGLGTNSFRIRINCDPEITIFTLKSDYKHKIEIL